MSLPDGVRQREYNKFVLDGENKTAVNTVVSSGTISGSFSPSGLNVALKVTTLTVGDTATALPVTALTSRNSISIQNKSTTQIVYIGDINVTADTVVGTTSGYELLPGSFFNVDVTPNITIYGRCESGQSALLKILELA